MFLFNVWFNVCNSLKILFNCKLVFCETSKRDFLYVVFCFGVIESLALNFEGPGIVFSITLSLPQFPLPNDEEGPGFSLTLWFSQVSLPNGGGGCKITSCSSLLLFVAAGGSL
jgi:hypothetical protein